MSLQREGYMEKTAEQELKAARASIVSFTLRAMALEFMLKDALEEIERIENLTVLQFAFMKLTRKG